MRLPKWMSFGLMIAFWPAALIAVDRAWVFAGEAHARAQCRNPGPLRVYDQVRWAQYSAAVHRAAQGVPEGYLRPEPVRKTLGIEYKLVKAGSKNPLFATTDHPRAKLLYNGRLVATLDFFTADALSPLVTWLPQTEGNSYICERGVMQRKYPEFII